jgi:hypothetical protein
MLAIIAPEPAPWIARALAEHEGPVWIFAPWDLSLEARWLPASLRAKVQRFVAPARDRSHVHGVLGWPLALAASRLWERGRTDRQLAARFAFRAAVDALASRYLPREATALLAPSGAARRSFAEALSRPRAVERTLIQDVPVLPALHADLERAAQLHPESVFLRRYRATHETVARQRAEWQLATTVRARGAYAAESLRTWGCACAITEPEPLARPTPLPVRPEALRTILLAGLAAARNGTHDALALLDALPNATLLVRRAEGSEPRALFEHPRVRESSERERRALEGVDLVIAPGLCEGYSPEVSLAIERGVSLVATDRARGACVVDERWDELVSRVPNAVAQRVSSPSL